MTKSALESALGEFFAECDEIIQRVTDVLTKAEGNQPSQDTIDSLYRDVHTLKGSAQLFGFSSIGTLAHAVEASLEPIRQGRIGLEGKLIDAIFECLDLVTRILKKPELDLEKLPELQEEMAGLLPKLVATATSMFEGASSLRAETRPYDASSDLKSIEVKPVVQAAPVKPVESVTATVIEEPVVASAKTEISPEPIINQAPIQPKKPSMEKPTEEHGGEANSIRVQVNLLDRLMNLVGEMVLTRNQVLQYARMNDNNEFLKLTQRLDLVTTELQDNVMRTRMQPIGSVFSKFQRVVRDLCRDLGKNIELTVVGAETELDKSLIEAIKDPLTHIVRNACDHGIEMPNVRKGNGKAEQGRLSLKAYHEGGQMVIEIHDDGGGLDPAKIKDKAIQKRVITTEKAATLTDRQAQELIFMPGFSTAEQVSAVSGRGVGMDVVKTNIEKVGGVVELESVPKQFTRIRMRIPLTLAIVPAMIVASGQEYFAIPQVKLQELLRVDLEEGGKIEYLQGRAVYRLRDQLLPLVSCHNLMTGQEEPKRSVYNIVVLNAGTHSYGLIVDEIKDTADIVVKPLPPFLKKADIFSGATIMGDGSVALIVDAQGIADHALGSSKDTQAAKNEMAAGPAVKAIQSTITEYLLVRISEMSYAIPLVLVNRLEEFNTASVDHSADESLVKYRDGLLPLLNVKQILNLPGESKEKTVSPVVVISKNNRLFGLAVDEIQDITQTENDIVGHIKPKDGLLGTVIGPQGNVLTIIDTYAIINKATGVVVEQKVKSTKKARVLLAEDTMFFVKQITKVLTNAGLLVEALHDGEAAYKHLVEVGPTYYDLIVSDIEMPKMNGFEFAKKVKTDDKFKQIPMIALTTRFKEVDQKNGLDCGFDRYLEKLQSDTLIDAINTLLGAKK